jgi:hypothetical protein
VNTNSESDDARVEAFLAPLSNLSPATRGERRSRLGRSAPSGKLSRVPRSVLALAGGLVLAGGGAAVATTLAPSSDTPTPATPHCIAFLPPAPSDPNAPAPQATPGGCYATPEAAAAAAQAGPPTSSAKSKRGVVSPALGPVVRHHATPSH